MDSDQKNTIIATELQDQRASLQIPNADCGIENEDRDKRRERYAWERYFFPFSLWKKGLLGTIGGHKKRAPIRVPFFQRNLLDVGFLLDYGRGDEDQEFSLKAEELLIREEPFNDRNFH